MGIGGAAVRHGNSGNDGRTPWIDARSKLVIEEGTPGQCRVDGRTADTTHPGFNGTGYTEVDAAAGKRIVWSVVAASGGDYPLELRYANPGKGPRSGRLTVNAGSSGWHLVNSVATGAEWKTETLKVSLRKGPNVLALASIGREGLALIDSVTLTGTGLTAGNCEELGISTQVLTANGALFKGDENTRGLKYPTGLVTRTAYRAVEGVSGYNHGAVLIPFRGKLYLQWQSSSEDEDAADTVVRFNSSAHGDSWSESETLVPARAGFVVTSGGWWTDGETLVAYINVWPQGLSPRGGHVEYIKSRDGVSWSAPARVRKANGATLDGIIEQDTKALPGGRLLTAVHEQPGLIVKPYYTEDPLGVSGWTRGVLRNLSHSGEVSRELEPSWYLRADGSIVMVFRDQGGSYKVLASSSHDNGATWTEAVETAIPDSRAKQSAGNLTDGSAFLVNNPSGSRARVPLAVTVSPFGSQFDAAWLLRGGEQLQKMRYEGKYKREGYSYPKSIVWKDRLWVSYSTNKEDIEVTRVPVSSLVPAWR